MEVKDTVVRFGELAFVSDHNDTGGRAYADRGWYEEYRNTFYSDVGREIAPHWVIDIGANYGLTVLLAHHRFPDAHIIAAEPIPKLADYIRRNVETNGVKNFTLFEGFVGESVGEGFSFHVLEHGTQDSRVRSPGSKWSETKVPQTTLDELGSFIPENQGIYIKIDTQGYEEHVFKGGEKLLARNRNWLIKTEFAPNWMVSQGTEPKEMLTYLLERYVVCEALPRSLFHFHSLRDATSRPIRHEEIDAFLDHVINLNRNNLGWVDLLVMPRELHNRVEKLPTNGFWRSLFGRS